MITCNGIVYALYRNEDFVVQAKQRKNKLSQNFLLSFLKECTIMSKKKNFVVASLAAAAVLASLNSQAAIITDSDSFTDALTEINNLPLRVDLFDPSLGTLTKVKVTIGASLRSEGTVTNTAAQAQDFTVSTRVQQYDGTVAAGGPAALTNPFSVFNAFDLIGTQDYVQLGSGTSSPFGPLTVDSGLLTVLESTDATVLNQFLGASDFGYDLTTLILTTIQGGGGNATTNISTFTSGQLNVEYEFTGTVTNVPEPGTLGLLALGLLFAGRKITSKA